MAMAGDIVVESQPSVEIDLFSCRECGSSRDNGDFYRPLNSVEGRVRVISAVRIKVTSLRMYFQGNQTAMVPNIDDGAVRVHLRRSKYKFLNVVQNVPITGLEESCNRDEHVVQDFKFFFIIPADLEQNLHNGSAGTAIFCKLPPTLQVTNPCVHWTDPISVVQASVRYTVSAVISFVEEGNMASDVQKQIATTKEIPFMPYDEDGPPIPITDFPNEFVTHSTTVLRGGFFSRHSGALHLNMVEPPALEYISATTLPVTTCSLRVSIDAPKAHQPRLGYIVITIESKVRAKTVSSLEPLRCMPNQELLSCNSTMCLNDEIIKTGKCKFQNLKWILVSPTPVPNLGPHSKTAEPSGATSLARWQTGLTIPITPSERLPSSFCSILVSRAYSVLLQVSVTGPMRATTNLEVPLQVVHKNQGVSWQSEPQSDRYSTQCLGVATLLCREEVSKLPKEFGILPANFDRLFLSTLGRSRVGEKI